MLPREQPDRTHAALDDHRLVANAGLILPVTLAHHLGLGGLVDRQVDLGDVPGRANAGDKLLTLVASALAGGDCIDDADALRAGGTEQVLGCAVKAPSTLGTFLRSFRWGHVRQLDRVSREVMARAWGAGAGPGDEPLAIDLDSSVCETYGLAKEGAQRHNYAGQRGYHPLLAIAAGTGDVLMVRLRKGRANTAQGAAHFLRETISRVRYAGATGPLIMRADSGFYNHDIVAVCRQMKARSSITIRRHPSVRNIIEAIPETDWTPIPYWMEGAADAAETTYTPFQHEPDAVPVRLIVRRVKPTPSSQLALFTTYSYHAFITDRDGDTLDLEADHRRHAEVENAIRDLKYGVGLNHLPSGRFPANAAWLAVQAMAHNLARWTARIGMGEPVITTKTLRRRFFSLAGRLTRKARSLILHLPQGWPWQNQFGSALARLRALPDAAIGISPVHHTQHLAGQRPGWAPDGHRLRSTLKIAPKPLPQAVNISLAWPPHTASSFSSASGHRQPAPWPHIPHLTGNTTPHRWIRAKSIGRLTDKPRSSESSRCFGLWCQSISATSSVVIHKVSATMTQKV